MSFWLGDRSTGSEIQFPTYLVTTENESIKSIYSDHSTRLRCSRGHGFTPSNHYSHRSRSPRHSQRSKKTDQSIQAISENKTLERPDMSRRNDEIIEVDILPQDSWGDNTTAVTGNSSNHSMSIDNLYTMSSNSDEGWIFKCQMWMGSFIAILVFFCAFISPLLMVVLPKLDFFDWKVSKCGPECDGLLISLTFKLIILIFGTWAVFLRRPVATMPRIFIFRAFILVLVLVFTFSYWLFYSVRIAEKRNNNHEVSYHGIVLFAVSLVDTLLFVHYLAVIFIQLRHLQPQYFVKIVRSPDGETHCYNMGQFSIQRAAVWVLERYYRDFSMYNPYLETLPSKHHKLSNVLKVYNVDGMENSSVISNSMATPRGNGRRRQFSHNDRFYKEEEYDRRVKKRKARLITSVEEAFIHIKRLRDEPGPAIPMDPSEAAQAIFPSMARALQKYLRITRQQPRHNVQAILEHLALCLSHDLSPRAFLEKYITESPVLQCDKEKKPVQKWALVCGTLLSRAVEAGCVFMLRQNDVSLLVTVHHLPHFNIIEEIINPKTNKFVLRLSSETSV